MKKSLLVALFTIALVLPVFAAEQGTMELGVKAGIPLAQQTTLDGTWRVDYDMKTTCSVGADFFYYLDYNVAVGLGVDHIFNSRLKYAPGEPKDKIGYTNIYFQVKYNFDFDDDGYNNIYPIFQLGYGLLHADWDLSEDLPTASVENGNGVYWGIGVGTTIARYFIMELIYSFNYGSAEFSGFAEPDFEYDISTYAFKFNVGFKFDFY
ncbi:MAG: hypothetical protein J6T23_01845 [Elusimicrobia bacterium]|nr:hypothetical protein [Elusimicrobiota bacterium]